MTGGRHFDLVGSACLALLEATESGDEHNRFEMRKKRFAYYLDDHHGDGRLALPWKAAPAACDVLLGGESACFSVPPYIGVNGWVGLYPDIPFEPQDAGVLIEEGYRLMAPKRRAAQISHQAAEV